MLIFRLKVMSILKKYQIFVSSTYTDLIEERQSAVEAILKAGHIPAGMELFTSSNKSQWEIIKSWIDESDIYMLILGGRYGSIEPESGKSYTHLEYEYALQINKPLFAIVMKDEVIAELKAKDTERDNPEKLKNFRGIVMSCMCAFFADEKDIKLAVHESLNDIIRKNPLIGWVRGTAQSENIAQEIALLNDENRKLREENGKLKAQQVKREPKLDIIINDNQELILNYISPRILFYQERQPITNIPLELKPFLSQEIVDEYNQELFDITPQHIEKYNFIQSKIYAIKNLSKIFYFELSNLGNLKANGVYITIEFPDFVYVMYADEKIDEVIEKLTRESLRVIPRPKYNPLNEAEQKYQESLNSKDSFSKIRALMRQTDYLTNGISRYPAISIPKIRSTPDEIIDNKIITIQLSGLLHDNRLLFSNYKIIPLSQGNGVIKISVHCEEYLEKQQFEIPITVK